MLDIPSQITMAENIFQPTAIVVFFLEARIKEKYF